MLIDAKEKLVGFVLLSYKTLSYFKCAQSISLKTERVSAFLKNRTNHLLTPKLCVQSSKVCIVVHSLNLSIKLR